MGCAGWLELGEGGVVGKPSEETLNKISTMPQYTFLRNIALSYIRNKAAKN